MKVHDGIFLLDGAGMDANVYCINSKVLVDTGSGMFFEETMEQMDKYGIDKNKIKKIVLTHEHFDHTGAAQDMKEELDAKLLAHKDADVTEESSLSAQFDQDFEKPDIDGRLKEGDSIKAGEYNFEVIHTPGHSPGGISLWDSNLKILVSGDLLFLDGFGRTDIPGGDREIIKKSLKRVKDLGDVKILLPGHGTPGSEHNIYEHGRIEEILSQIE